MNTRLQQFISAENISQSQFADTIGVARASISHILAGRNKPGFDFIESMARHYPTLNLEWLIMGKGKMYKSDNLQTPASSSVSTDQLNLFAGVEDSPAQEPSNFQTRQESEPRKTKESSTSNEIQEPRMAENSKAFISGGKIQKIIVFYDDGTYQELK